jgi:hypothetical protein
MAIKVFYMYWMSYLNLYRFVAGHRPKECSGSEDRTWDHIAEIFDGQSSSTKQ